MTRLIINGPVPPEGARWCPVCVATWKTALVEANGIDTAEKFAAWAKEKLSGPDEGPPVVLAPPPHVKMPALAEPVTRAPVRKMNGAVLDVCWTHADAFELDAPGTPVRKPPGLIAGMS